MLRKQVRGFNTCLQLNLNFCYFFQRQPWSNSIEQHNYCWSVVSSSLQVLEQSDWFQWCHFHWRQKLIGSHCHVLYSHLTSLLSCREIWFPALFVVEAKRCFLYLPTPLYSSWKPFWFSSGKSGRFFLVLSEISITSSRRKRFTIWKIFHFISVFQ